MSVRNKERHAVYALAGRRVNLVNEERRGFAVGQSHSGDFAVRDFDIMRLAVKYIAISGIDFDCCVPAVGKIINIDDAARIRRVGANALTAQV